jgi:hypothetical protein
MQHTRPNVWTILSVLLLLFPATCVGQQPTIKALMKYIDASRPMACPVPAPISDEFRGLSARTLQLKTMVTTIQSGLNELEEKEVKRSTTTHLANLAAALDGASGTPGQEATICTAANSAFDKNQTTFPFIPPATSTLALVSPVVGTVAVSRFPNKDLYRLGIGFDLLEIKNALTKKTTDTKQEAPPAASATAGAAAQD